MQLPKYSTKTGKGTTTAAKLSQCCQKAYYIHCDAKAPSKPIQSSVYDANSEHPVVSMSVS
jgi:hypothetical protein